MCPSCKKALSNSVRIYGTSPWSADALLLHGPDPLVMKPCSHVTCKTCIDTLVRPANQCVVCDKLLAEGDILELKREGGSPLLTCTYFFSYFFQGTGYAGGGMAETRKIGVAFQG
jgi:nitric oxide synthase-interacting protein